MASWRPWLVAVGLLLSCASATAAVRLQAATLSLPGVELAEVHADATVAADGRLALHLDAAKVSIPALGWRNVGLTLDGQPQRTDGGTWKLVGQVTTRGAPGGALAAARLEVLLDPTGGTLTLSVAQGGSSLEALLPLDQASHVQLQLTGVPLAWLRGVLAAAWPAGQLKGGRITGTAALDLAAGDTRASGRVSITGADLDSQGGTMAAQKLGAEGTFRFDTGPAASVMFDGQLRGGQLLLGPLYAQLPKYAVGLHLAGGIGPAGVTLDSLDFDDPTALRLAGSLAFDAHGALDKLDLNQFAATFPAAYARYGTSLVQSLTGLTALTTAGSVKGSLAIGHDGPRAIDLTARDLTLGGGAGTLQIAGLDGRLDWRAGASRAPTHLQWDALSLYRVALGPARLALEDANGTLKLRAPVNVGVFGGNLQLGRFAWRPDGGAAPRLSASLAVTGVDLGALCKALGWPAFAGQLGGAAPEVTYRKGELVFGGGLSMDVFGGSVSVTGLRLQHLFGTAPELAADVGMHQLDLAQLTGVFDFGRITGRMDGAIRGLQMVNWKPTAFAASLTADSGGKISQDAIKSLTEVGGGGIAGGLQSMALRLFKTFDYARIGLSCTLADGVCSMAGIVPDPDADDQGYTIVQGSGLPHITVIGHQRSVDWATLVSRVEAVTKGSAPVIR
ncbi:MAG: hypothetical protein EPN38_11525 [Rhodanobacteraceae bacterium]|nr:MAG: hypothetical protein EPN38_11525 [Rhodanobacteraceae bacterium]